MTDAWKLLDQKLTVPSDMRTAEWSMLPQWLRERSFYMAGVTRAEILQEFRNEAGRIARGETSIPQSEKNLEQFLDRVGYEPAPGDEGTIRDLRSMSRMRVALRTNVQLLQGWQQKERGLRPGPATAFPAWELVRYEPRTNEREWYQRWSDAGGVPVGGRLVALKDDPIWQRIGSRELFPDALGVDYPPFAWGSGMGWKAIGYTECVTLGLISEDWKAPAPTPVSSPNASLRSTPAVTERELRDALAERMRGLAQWNGDVFEFTDPNGTRPMPAETLAEVWDRGMPEDFEDLPGGGLFQKDALLRWLGDHSAFRDAAATLAWHDLQRLASRLVSASMPASLYRGITLPAMQLDAFLRANAKQYTTRLNYPLESWTSSQAAAIQYGRTGGNGWSVLLEVKAPQAAADFSHFARHYASQVKKQPTPPLQTESEWVYLSGKRFRVAKITRDTQTRTVRMELEEAR